MLRVYVVTHKDLLGPAVQLLIVDVIGCGACPWRQYGSSNFDSHCRWSARHCSSVGACFTSCDQSELKETKATTTSQNCFTVATSIRADVVTSLFRYSSLILSNRFSISFIRFSIRLIRLNRNSTHTQTKLPSTIISMVSSVVIPMLFMAHPRCFNCPNDSTSTAVRLYSTNCERTKAVFRYLSLAHDMSG